MPPSTQHFRDALAAVATSVAIAATVSAGERCHAVTIGSLCSLSLDPPLVLFCLDRGGTSHAVFATAGRYSITILAADQADVARRFAAPAECRPMGMLAVRDGLPMLPGGLVHLLCSAYSVTAGGDHSIIIGRVESIVQRGGSPLLYHGREFCQIADAVECSETVRIDGEMFRTRSVNSPSRRGHARK